MGFGRIGRSLMKVALKQGCSFQCLSRILRTCRPWQRSSKSIPTTAAGLRQVRVKDSCLIIGGREIPYFDSMKGLPNWQALGVDVVIDCTGRATTRSGAQAHLDAGAKHVLVSAPSKTKEDCDAVLLPGINLESSTQRNIRSSVWRVARPMRWLQ